MTTTTSRVARVHPQLVLPSCHRLSDTVSMCTSCAARALCAWRALGVVRTLFDVHAVPCKRKSHTEAEIALSLTILNTESLKEVRNVAIQLR